MGILSVFSKNKASTVKDKGDCASTTGSVSTRNSSVGDKSKTARSKRKPKQPEAIQLDEKSLNLKAAQAWMEAMNNLRTDDPEGVKKLMDHFVNKDSPVILEDGETYTAEQAIPLLHVLFESFPDFKFRYGDIAPVGNKPDRISVEDVYAEGTFTGKPYTVLPGVLPPLTANGKYYCNDEQRFEITFENGKIAKFELYALGIHTGFVGFYIQAGGSLVPPNADSTK